MAKLWVEQKELFDNWKEEQHIKSVPALNETQYPPILITTDAVNLVLQAWCISNNGEKGAVRAERLLHWFEDLHSNDTTTEKSLLPRPDYQSYATVIDAWSRAAVYESTHSRTSESTSKGKTKRDIPEAIRVGFECAKKGEELLMHMQKVHEKRLENQQIEPYSSEIQPDTQVFHLVLKAWAHIQGSKASATRAMRIMDLMQELHHYQSMNVPHWQGLNMSKVQPNIMTYKLILKAWANAATPEGPDRAEEILRHCYSLSKAGNMGVEIMPDEECFHIVMKAHTESVRKRGKNSDVGHVSSVDRARQVVDLLDWMELLAKRPKTKIQPNTDSYRIALSAWVWSHHVDAPKEAESILFRMIRASESTDGGIEKLLNIDAGSNKNTPKVQPETRDFNTLINCCVFARGVGSNPQMGSDELEMDLLQQQFRRETFLIAEGALQALLSSPHAQADSATFVGMIRACLNLLPNNEERDARVIDLFRLAYRTPLPIEQSSPKLPSSSSERLKPPVGGGCVDANVLRELRRALPIIEDYIRVREEFEDHRRRQ